MLKAINTAGGVGVVSEPDPSCECRNVPRPFPPPPHEGSGSETRVGGLARVDHIPDFCKNPGSDHAEEAIGDHNIYTMQVTCKLVHCPCCTLCMVRLMVDSLISEIFSLSRGILHLAFNHTPKITEVKLYPA